MEEEQAARGRACVERALEPQQQRRASVEDLVVLGIVETANLSTNATSMCSSDSLAGIIKLASSFVGSFVRACARSMVY